MAEEDLEQQLKDFMRKHYLNADFEIWSRKNRSLYLKFQGLKDPRKQTAALLELYTGYLQTAETLFVNIHAVSKSLAGFPGALFIDNQRLRKLVDNELTKNTKFLEWYLLNYVFFGKKDSELYKKRHDLYRQLLKECAKDYLADYQLLNAYKHGYRVTANKGKSQLSIRPKAGEAMLLDEYDSSILYFAKENREEEKVITENTVNFKNDRIFGKTLFLTSLLSNLRAVALLRAGYKGRAATADFNITDKKIWEKGYGSWRSKQPVFSLKK